MGDKKFMEIAIKEAKKGELPFGAVIVKNGKIISKAYNTVTKSDPTAHAEINAIRKACKKLNSRHIESCTLYSTCEPCPMCFAAAWWAKISKIVYGAEENVLKDIRRFNVKIRYLNERSGKKIKIKGCVLKDKCTELLRG